jgi:ABC-type phosphate/phosphonate transport system substrate-binding protein
MTTNFFFLLNVLRRRTSPLAATATAQCMAVALVFVALNLLATQTVAAPLKLVIQEESGAEGDALPPLSKYSALKRSLETALGRPVDIALTRDRQRMFDWMQANQGDVFMTHSGDLAARALAGLGYTFIATARPDVNVLFIGKGAPVENLKAFSGNSISMPRAESHYGQVCAAELRDFIGRQYTARFSTEYSAVVYAVENNLSTVGCIPSVAKARETLAAKGIKVLYEGRMQSAMPVIAGVGLPAADRAAIAKVITAYDESPAGEAILKSLGVGGFTQGGEIRLRALTAWLQSK